MIEYLLLGFHEEAPKAGVELVPARARCENGFGPFDVTEEQLPVVTLEDIVDPELYGVEMDVDDEMEVDGVETEEKETVKSSPGPSTRSQGAASAASLNPLPKSVPRPPSDSGLLDAEAASLNKKRYREAERFEE